MFDNVIVGVDDREAGRDALGLARQLVSSHGRLTLVYVKVVMLKPEPDSGAVSLAAERRSAMKRLASLRDESHVDARVLSIEARSVAAGLHELAHGLDAELLVVSACRRDDYDRMFVGDDTRAVLENAPCPVAVAPLAYASGPSALSRIGAAYDGSPESERALALARQLAREHSAELSAFEAVPEPLYVHDAWNPQPEIDEGVAKARERVARSGDVEAHAASGDAAEELARYGAVGRPAGRRLAQIPADRPPLARQHGPTARRCRAVPAPGALSTAEQQLGSLRTRDAAHSSVMVTGEPRGSLADARHESHGTDAHGRATRRVAGVASAHGAPDRRSLTTRSLAVSVFLAAIEDSPRRLHRHGAGRDDLCSVAPMHMLAHAVQARWEGWPLASDLALRGIARLAARA